jgi:hypothetical protein
MWSACTGAVMGNRRRSLIRGFSLNMPRVACSSVGGDVGMTKARLPIEDTATLKVAEEVLDEVWDSLAPYLAKNGEKAEASRMRLANIVLDLAKDGQLGALEMTRAAARLMRETIERADKPPRPG